MRLDPFLQLGDYGAEYRYGNSYRYNTDILLTYRYFAPVYFFIAISSSLPVILHTLGQRSTGVQNGCLCVGLSLRCPEWKEIDS